MENFWPLQHSIKHQTQSFMNKDDILSLSMYPYHPKSGILRRTEVSSTARLMDIFQSRFKIAGYLNKICPQPRHLPTKMPGMTTNSCLARDCICILCFDLISNILPPLSSLLMFKLFVLDNECFLMIVSLQTGTILNLMRGRNCKLVIA